MCAVDFLRFPSPSFSFQLNHRLLLEGMFAVCGVSQADFKTVCSSIDKLDKVEWDVVRAELTEEKHVEGKVVDALEQFVRIRGAGVACEWE